MRISYLRILNIPYILICKLSWRLILFNFWWEKKIFYI
jgi:hypothetical protein